MKEIIDKLTNIQEGCGNDQGELHEELRDAAATFASFAVKQHTGEHRTKALYFCDAIAAYCQIHGVSGQHILRRLFRPCGKNAKVPPRVLLPLVPSELSYDSLP